MLDFKATNSGKRVVINEVPMMLAIKLKKVILREVQKYPVGLKVIKALNNSRGKSLNQIIADIDVDFSSVLDFVKDCLIGLDTSDDVMTTVFECLSYCTYDNVHKINEQLFDEVRESRADYYEIIHKCVECNISPFLQSLQSELNNLLGKVGSNPLMNVILTESDK